MAFPVWGGPACVSLYQEGLKSSPTWGSRFGFHKPFSSFFFLESFANTLSPLPFRSLSYASWDQPSQLTEHQIVVHHQSCVILNLLMLFVCIISFPVELLQKTDTPLTAVIHLVILSITQTRSQRVLPGCKLMTVPGCLAAMWWRGAYRGRCLLSSRHQGRCSFHGILVDAKGMGGCPSFM